MRLAVGLVAEDFAPAFRDAVLFAPVLPDAVLFAPVLLAAGRLASVLPVDAWSAAGFPEAGFAEAVFPDVVFVLAPVGRPDADFEAGEVLAVFAEESATPDPDAEVLLVEVSPSDPSTAGLPVARPFAGLAFTPLAAGRFTGVFAALVPEAAVRAAGFAGVRAGADGRVERGLVGFFSAGSGGVAEVTS